MLASTRRLTPFNQREREERSRSAAAAFMFCSLRFGWYIYAIESAYLLEKPRCSAALIFFCWIIFQVYFFSGNNYFWDRSILLIISHFRMPCWLVCAKTHFDNWINKQLLFVETLVIAIGKIHLAPHKKFNYACGNLRVDLDFKTNIARIQLKGCDNRYSIIFNFNKYCNDTCKCNQR